MDVVTDPDRAAPFAEQEPAWASAGWMIGAKEQFRLLRFDRLPNSDILGPPTTNSENQPLGLDSPGRASDTSRNLAVRPCAQQFDLLRSPIHIAEHSEFIVWINAMLAASSAQSASSQFQSY